MIFDMKQFGEYKLKCPRGHGLMRKIKKHDVIIDVCEKCNGLWLDDQEIEKLVKIAGRKSGSKKVKKNTKGE